MKELSCPKCGNRLYWSCLGTKGEAYCAGVESRLDPYGRMKDFFCGFFSEIRRISPNDVELIPEDSQHKI